MTPLARLLTKDVILNRASSPDTRKTIRDLLYDVHCFDVTEIRDLAETLAKTWDDRRDQITSIGHLLFLPAPNTWIEMKTGVGEDRIGYKLCNEQNETGLVHCTAVSLENGTSAIFPIGWIDFRSHKTIVQSYRSMNQSEFENLHDNMVRNTRFLYAVLSMINTPKIIGRRQIMPRSSFERKVITKLGRGQFPLHAFTEIRLMVTKPIEIDDGETHEAYLTGRRALHFCRAHIRIRLGRLEYVSAHWRGDPAIGIKQSRYVVTH